MIYKKIQHLLASQFSVFPEDLTDERFLLVDLPVDLVDLAIALEETFGLDPVEDLSHLETLGDLVDFVQEALNM